MREAPILVDVPGLEPEPTPTLANQRIIWPLITMSRAAIFPRTHFEAGAEQEIIDHRDADGSLLILSTHFSRFVEPATIARTASTKEPLKHIRYKTGVTARRELFDIPVLSSVLRACNAEPVARKTERQNETPEERLARQQANQQALLPGSRYLAGGFNWLIFPEGSSRETVKNGDKEVRQKRRKGELLPIREGFARILENLTPEERSRVKMLGIAAHYGDGRLSLLRPTVHIARPTSVVEGSREEMRQQGEDLLRHSLLEAIRLHNQPRSLRKKASVA
jgi:1-acyl-sn-glycerol-3-phosphate acyltransferase